MCSPHHGVYQRPFYPFFPQSNGSFMSIPHLRVGEKPLSACKPQWVHEASRAGGENKPSLRVLTRKEGRRQAEQSRDQVQVLGSLLLFGGWSNDWRRWFTFKLGRAPVRHRPPATPPLVVFIQEAGACSAEWVETSLCLSLRLAKLCARQSNSSALNAASTRREFYIIQRRAVTLSAPLIGLNYCTLFLSNQSVKDRGAVKGSRRWEGWRWRLIL